MTLVTIARTLRLLESVTERAMSKIMKKRSKNRHFSPRFVWTSHPLFDNLNKCSRRPEHANTMSEPSVGGSWEDKVAEAELLDTA